MENVLKPLTATSVSASKGFMETPASKVRNTQSCSHIQVHIFCLQTFRSDCLLVFLLAVVVCEKDEVRIPQHGSVSCTHKHGDFTYNSLCMYSCEEGYQLSMPRPLRCNASGNWSEEPPTCECEFSKSCDYDCHLTSCG